MSTRWYNPQRSVLRPSLQWWCDWPLLQATFSGGRCGVTPNACVDDRRAWPCAVYASTSATGVHHRCHRGKLSVPKASTHGWMPVHGMSQYRPNVALELCWPWCPMTGNMVLSPAARGLCPRGYVVPVWSGGQYQSSVMGMLRVKGIATLEVKFLDRCKTNSGKGVLQEHVRRSRM